MILVVCAPVLHHRRHRGQDLGLVQDQGWGSHVVREVLQTAFRRELDLGLARGVRDFGRTRQLTSDEQATILKNQALNNVSLA